MYHMLNDNANKQQDDLKKIELIAENRIKDLNIKNAHKSNFRRGKMITENDFPRVNESSINAKRSSKTGL